MFFLDCPYRTFQEASQSIKDKRKIVIGWMYKVSVRTFLLFCTFVYSSSILYTLVHLFVHFAIFVQFENFCTVLYQFVHFVYVQFLMYVKVCTKHNCELTVHAHAIKLLDRFLSNTPCTEQYLQVL